MLVRCLLYDDDATEYGFSRSVGGSLCVLSQLVVPPEVAKRFDDLLDRTGLYDYLPTFSEFRGVSYDDPVCNEFLYGIV
jgi:hypothetical protein